DQGRRQPAALRGARLRPLRGGLRPPAERPGPRTAQLGGSRMRLSRRHRLVFLTVAALAAALITADVRWDAAALREWGASVAGPVQRLAAKLGDDPADRREVRLAAAGWAGQ